MSGLFNKKFTEQQDYQEGQVPDDLSESPTHNDQPHNDHKAEDKKLQHDEDQFIFETVPDNEFETDYPQRDKPNYKTQDSHPAGQQFQKKDWERHDRNDRDKRQDKGLLQKSNPKKQIQNHEIKSKLEIHDDHQMRLPIPGQVAPTPMGYYPGIVPPPIGNPYNPGYYPPYGVIPPVQAGTRPPYGIYPQLHHHPPPNLYVQSPQGPYQLPNPHIYQIPPPQMAYGSVPITQPIPELYPPQIMQASRPVIQQAKPYNYDQQRIYQQNGGYSSQRPPKIYQQRERQDQRQQDFGEKYSQNRFPQQRQRSRDRKDYYAYQASKAQTKPKYYDKQSQHQSYQRQHSKDYHSQNEKKTVKQAKKSQQEEEKLKLKTSISEQLKVLFLSNQEEKEEFLLIVRDILKFRLLKREEEQTAKYNGFEVGKPAPIYTLNKDLIEGNYNKALLKLENLLITLAQAQNSDQSDNANKKDALILILAQLELEDLVTKIKEMRLKKKLVGERKMSEIKKLLEEMVKDPRKKIK